MMFLFRKLSFLFAFVFSIALLPFNANAFSFFHFSNASSLANSQSHVIKTVIDNTSGLSPKVLQLALMAYTKLHQRGYDQQQLLTIVDYSQPSTKPRMWVIDLKTLQVPFHELVAHGKNSGGNVPDAFSDNPRSLESSIGVYLTENTYFGHDGYSLRLNGLEPGFNDTAEERDIVMHPAEYVSEEFARIHGRLGRSWGCFALNPVVAPNVINTIKDGTVIFAYYPDQQWLKQSAFLRT